MNKTIQREAIIGELRKMKTHPTADELYSVLRHKVPQISLGTVYRNLEDMAQRGMIRKLELTGRQKRFDGEITPHHHLRCKHCGRIVDLRAKILPKLDKLFHDLLPSLGCDGVFIEWAGLCPECRQNQQTKEGDHDGEKSNLQVCSLRADH